MKNLILLAIGGAVLTWAAKKYNITSVEQVKNLVPQLKNLVPSLKQAVLA